MSDSPKDPFEQTIVSLVHGRDVSVRLKNCIDGNPSVGSLTLGAFLSDPAETRRLLLSLRNLGRKTADELTELAAAAASEPWVGPATSVPEPPARLAFRSLVNVLSRVDFPGDLLAMEMSARLRKSLNAIGEAQRQGGNGDDAHRNLGAVVADWPDYRRRLVKQANVGRTTVAELEKIIEKIVGRCLGLLSEPTAEVAVAMEALSEERLDEVFHQALINAADSPADNAPSDLAVMLHGIDPNLRLAPRQHIYETISKLPGEGTRYDHSALRTGWGRAANAGANRVSGPRDAGSGSGRLRPRRSADSASAPTDRGSSVF